MAEQLEYHAANSFAMLHLGRIVILLGQF